NPCPGEIPRQRRQHILGGQANLWTEYMKSPAHVEYMAFPRACALTEALWTAAPNRSFEDFLRRLKQHRERLRILQVNAHPLP
ncbi:MAG: family 20 glycosylhydrolase, partial [Victivallales bacterium]|nr:family 20 glycosylhydrolase [Victivallales bacterium]